MGATARVLVHYQAPPAGGTAVVRAYHEASSELAGTPGLVRSELLADRHRPRQYAVLSEWEDETAFLAWEQGPSHQRQTAPLRPYLSEVAHEFGIYRVVAAYPEPA